MNKTVEKILKVLIQELPANFDGTAPESYKIQRDIAHLIHSKVIVEEKRKSYKEGFEEGRKIR